MKFDPVILQCQMREDGAATFTDEIGTGDWSVMSEVAEEFDLEAGWWRFQQAECCSVERFPINDDATISGDFAVSGPFETIAKATS